MNFLIIADLLATARAGFILTDPARDTLQMIRVRTGERGDSGVRIDCIMADRAVHLGLRYHTTLNPDFQFFQALAG